jgi:hypothetical protein
VAKKLGNSDFNACNRWLKVSEGGIRLCLMKSTVNLVMLVRKENKLGCQITFNYERIQIKGYHK